jgi:hypothetical protein
MVSSAIGFDLGAVLVAGSTLDAHQTGSAGAGTHAVLQCLLLVISRMEAAFSEFRSQLASLPV